MVDQKAVQEPRPYQDTIFKQAIKENTIAFLETGTGKTLIACLLAKEFATPLDLIDPSLYEELVNERKAGITSQHDLLESLPKLNKKVVFLVPKTPLVKQQAIQLKRNAELVVQEYQGNIDHFQTKDVEDAALWHRQWSLAQAIVMTPQILLNLLKVGFITLEYLSLIIFDEAHHCSGDHAYVHIMRDYYHHLPLEGRPRIFGMTASPLHSKSTTDTKVHQDIQQLQDRLMSKLVTVDPELIDKYAPRAKTIILFFEPYVFNYTRSEIQYYMVNNALIDIVDPVYRYYLYYRQLLYQNKDFKVIRDGDFILHELGPWLAGQYLSVNCSSEGNMIFTPLSDIDPLKHISSKCNTLVIDINKSYQSSVKSLIFVPRRCLVYSLSWFLNTLAQQDVIPLHCKALPLEASMNENLKATTISHFNSEQCNLLITTSVAEEGLDISACSIVYMFAIPSSSKALIQTRGRARHLQSHYILFVQQGDEKTLFELANRTTEESYQTSVIRNNQISIDPKYQSYYDDIEQIQDSESESFRTKKAQCDLYDAIHKLETYCNGSKLEFKLIIAPGRTSTKTIQKYLYLRKQQAIRIKEKAPSNYKCDIPIPTCWQEKSEELDDFYTLEDTTELNGPFLPTFEGQLPKCSDTQVSYMYAYEVVIESVHLTSEIIISPLRSKMKSAKQMAALMAIKRLYYTGGLNELLLPAHSVCSDAKLNKLLNSSKFVKNEKVIINVDTGDDYGKDGDKLMNHDTLRMYKRVTSSFFTPKETAKLYPIAISFGPEAYEYLMYDSTMISSLCILSNEPLPVELPDSVIWISQQTPCRVKYHLMDPITVTVDVLDKINRFQSVFFHNTLRKIHHMDLSKRIQDITSVEAAEKSIYPDQIPKWLQQLRDANFMNSVDFKVLPVISKLPIKLEKVQPLFNASEFKRFQNYHYEYLTHPVEPTSFKIDYKMINKVLKLNDHSNGLDSVFYTYASSKYSSIMEFSKDSKQLPITSFDRSYFIEDIVEMSIHERLPESKMTYYEYYYNKYNIKVPDSPFMIKVKNSYTLSNHQFPNINNSQNTGVNKKKQQELFISPHVAYILPFHITYLKVSNLIPSVFYKLEHITRSIDVSRQLDICISSSSSLNKITQALMHAESLECMNYERLEFLGDSFLKYAVGLYLFLKNPTWNEGQLSIKRSALVRNSFLCQISQKYELPEKTCMKHLHPQLFCAKYMDCELMTKVHSMDFEENWSFEKWNGERMISNKNVADLIESLIGSVYSIDGEQGAFKLLIKLEIIEPLQPLLTQFTIPPYLGQLAQIKQCESTLKYQYQQPSLFYQSTQLHTLKFDRLEYLGDGVMDFCCALYGYINFPMDMPNKLTQFKQSLVENVAFSRACFKLRLFQFCRSNTSANEQEFFNNLQQIETWDMDTFEKTCSVFKGKKLMGDIFESFCGGLFLDCFCNLHSIWSIVSPTVTSILIDESKSNKSIEMVFMSCLRKCGYVFTKCQLVIQQINGYTCQLMIDDQCRAATTHNNLNTAKLLACQSFLSHLDKSILYEFKMTSFRENIAASLFSDSKNATLLQLA